MERRLNQPFLPQMRDGVITQGDIETPGIIYVIIRPYTNVQLYDFIILHFGNLSVRTYVVDDTNSEIVVEFKIDAETVPDGEYLVWYEVIDAAENSTGPSPAGWAIVNRRDNGTLVAPDFINADTNHVINDASVQQNQGTNVFIPTYSGMAQGDILNLIFNVTGSDDELIINSLYRVTHTIDNNDPQDGITLLVPSPYILVPGGATCHARYNVHPADGTPDMQSLTGQARLLLTGPEMLPAPTFSDAVYGWLTAAQVVNDIHIQASWPDMTADDKVVMNLAGFDADGSPVSGAVSTQTRTLTQPEVEKGLINFTFNSSAAQAVSLGRLNAWYSVTNQTSIVGSVNVDMSHESPLPPPEFIQAHDGVLNESTIDADKGAKVQIRYPDMTVGDNISVYISGKNDSGQNVPGASTLLSSLVSNQNVTDGYLNFVIPVENALAPGERGTLYAQYTVDYAQNAGFAYSAPEEVTLNMSSSSSLAMVVATGAPIYDATLQIYPQNKGKLYGQAGANVTLSCEAHAQFTESGSNILTVSIDRNGEARFSVRSTETGEVTILATDNQTSESVEGYTSFVPYHFTPGVQGIQSWGVSTGSAADGVMPSTIYLVVAENPAVKHVEAIITEGNATFLETADQSHSFLLNTDMTVAIELISTSPDENSVRISLPESTGNVLEFDVSFVRNLVQKYPLHK